jgi:hypothetical protein
MRGVLAAVGGREDGREAATWSLAPARPIGEETGGDVVAALKERERGDAGRVRGK